MPSFSSALWRDTTWSSIWASTVVELLLITVAFRRDVLSHREDDGDEEWGLCAKMSMMWKRIDLSLEFSISSIIVQTSEWSFGLGPSSTRLMESPPAPFCQHLTNTLVLRVLISFKSLWAKRTLPSSSRSPGKTSPRLKRGSWYKSLSVCRSVNNAALRCRPG